MGPNVKFVSPICDLIFERKNRGNFFIRKKTIKNTVFFSDPFPKIGWGSTKFCPWIKKWSGGQLGPNFFPQSLATKILWTKTNVFSFTL